MRGPSIIQLVFLSIVAICTCSAASALDANGAETSSRSQEKTPIYLQNLHSAIAPSMFLISHANAVAAHLNLDWAKMSQLRQTIANGGDPVATTRGQKESVILLSQWAELKAGMMLALKGDYAAMFFDTAKGRWATCASFSTDGVVQPMTFCAFNSNVDLPVPCRAPKQSIDFLVITDRSQSLYEAPNNYNVGPYACSKTEIVEARKLAHEAAPAKRYLSNVFRWSENDSVETYTAGSSACDKEKYPTCCHRACCNSGFSSSPFCQANDSRRCY